MKSLSCHMSKKSFFAVVFALLAVSPSLGSAAEPMASYCQVPPHVVQNSPPNILIIFDNSGSMHEFAYKNTSGHNTYNNAFRYYGYFNPDQWYTYNGVFQPAGAMTGARPANSWSGNFLNWLTMRRVDVLRKILTGGKYVSSGGTTRFRAEVNDGRDTSKAIDATVAAANTPYPDARNFSFTTTGQASTFSVRNASNSVIVATVVTEVVTTPPVEGVLQTTVGDKARIGLMFYNPPNKNDNGGFVEVSVGGSSLNATINAITNTYPATNTPLGETLWSAVGYFAQQASSITTGGVTYGQSDRGPRYNNGDYQINNNNDPMNFGSGGSPYYPSCQKNFVLLLTDGEPTQDGYLPPNILNYAEGRSNFACSGNTCPSRSGPGYLFSGSNTGATGLEDVALFMHTNDMRQDIPGFQNITLFTVFAFGAGSTLLQYAAINGGFGATRPSDSPSAGPPYNWDKNADGVPDNYFEASGGEDLENAVRNAFLGILQRASSGTAASVLASGEGSGANLVQALYYPGRSIEGENVAWTSEIRNLWYYVDPFFTNSAILEETSPDSILDLSSDYIIEFYSDSGATRVRKYNSDAQGNKGTLQDDVDFEQAKSLWDAGKKLLVKSANSRTIWTSVNGSTLLEFSEANMAAIQPYFIELATLAPMTINYVRGIDYPGLRSRTVPSGTDNAVWKLGDVINSSPQIVASTPLNKYFETYNDQTYKKFTESTLYKNRGMVFAGGNDGMLHAFHFGKLETNWVSKPASQKARLTSPNGQTLGDEAWAFIPKNALPYLRYLKDPDYCHLYYVDLAPYIFDASIAGASTDTRTENSWRTVLIGGMRTGGACDSAATCTNANNCVRTPTGAGAGFSSYFALDVTDPENPTMMWEFSTTNATLGFATTGPSVVRMNAVNPVSLNRDQSLNGEWYVVFGSGPTGPIIDNQFMGRSNQPLRFFVLDLKTGTLLKTIETGIANAFAGSMLNTVADFELDYNDDVIYTGYVKSASGTSNWNDGGVGRIQIKNSPPTAWEFSMVLDGIGPVTSAIARLQSKTLSTNWLFFGTGRFFYDVKGDASVASTDDGTTKRGLFGIKEPCFTTNNTINPSCTTTLVMDGKMINVTNILKVPEESDANSSDINGWYVELEAAGNYPYDGSTQGYWAERVITNPVPTTSGLVHFMTFKPYSDECTVGGKSFLWAMRYNTGGTPSLGVLKSKALVQVSTGSVEQINMSSAFTTMDGRRTAAIEGVPPSAQGLSLLTAPPPVKRIMHMIER